MSFAPQGQAPQSERMHDDNLERDLAEIMFDHELETRVRAEQSAMEAAKQEALAAERLKHWQFEQQMHAQAQADRLQMLQQMEQSEQMRIQQARDEFAAAEMRQHAYIQNSIAATEAAFEAREHNLEFKFATAYQLAKHSEEAHSAAVVGAIINEAESRHTEALVAERQRHEENMLAALESDH